MSTILITGASGFIGKALATALAPHHQVICLSRRAPGLADLPFVRGDFGAFEDLRQLDRYAIDVVIHLAAVTGGCFERDGIMVNVEGTRALMRYLMDRGCQKFVMASSIAAVGFQNTKFRPVQLPIPDEHPCLDRDGYGLSKYLMEEVTRYCQRQVETIDVINLRLSSVRPDDQPGILTPVRPLGPWALGSITIMLLADAVRAFTLAAEAPHQPGVRILNATAARAWAAAPTATLLRNWWGEAVDLSYFEQPGQAYAAAYDVRAIERELGFTATATLQFLAQAV
ncbi:MAG: NAD(P)-dependent oxidoreductase [Caldilineaceae bacterium]|nr:NAD(P)-dependent oxidoreductase [Caldilineaceae bacterium]